MVLRRVARAVPVVHPLVVLQHAALAIRAILVPPKTPALPRRVEPAARVALRPAVRVVPATRAILVRRAIPAVHRHAAPAILAVRVVVLS